MLVPVARSPRVATTKDNNPFWMEGESEISIIVVTSRNGGFFLSWPGIFIRIATTSPPADYSTPFKATRERGTAT
jgi:hypothetical protein